MANNSDNSNDDMSSGMEHSSVGPTSDKRHKQDTKTGKGLRHSSIRVCEKVKSTVADDTIPEDVVDDLCSRFIINIPQEERTNLVRVCFQIELAHWFYIDYYCSNEKGLPKCQFREFAKVVFSNIPFLRQHVERVDSVIEKWREYKMAVPTYGAILLDKHMENVLMVQGFWARSSWGFPKGKVNADEDPVVCACREVLEETGYDCASAISAKDYIELNIQDTLIRLYIVTGVDMDTVFKPQTRCEIKSCNWFKISELPMTRKDMVTIQNKTIKPNAFFMAIPFIKPLRKWISRRRRSALGIEVEDQDEDSKLNITNVTINTTLNTTLNDSVYIIKSPPLYHQQQHNQQQQQSVRKRFWSQTWSCYKLDWDQIAREIYIK